jgi:hypothetical protein
MVGHPFLLAELVSVGGLEMRYPHPRQFAWLSKQRGCRRGRFGIDWKQKRYKRAKRAKQKAEGRSQKG